MNRKTALSIREIESLFQPFYARKLPLVSRVVMAPMNRNLALDGVPMPEMAAYYRRRAERQIGLIISESATIDDAAAADDSGMPQFHGGAALREWKRICRAVHGTDCKMVIQLCHVGMLRAGTKDGALPIGPSGISPLTLERCAEPMNVQRIAEVCESFGRAAALARKLGFDGVELQGGHGYLIDQFLWKETNRRKDIYGGDIVGRTRFACEVIHSVRKAVGRDFPILFRFSQWKIGHLDARLVDSPHELGEMLRCLCDAGVDIFDCSEWYHAAPAFPGNALSLASWTRMLSGRPVISGGFGDGGDSRGSGNESEKMRHLLRMLQSGEIDLVAVGRALLADAEWAEKMRQAREAEIIPFTLRSLSRLF